MYDNVYIIIMVCLHLFAFVYILSLGTQHDSIINIVVEREELGQQTPRKE